GLAEDEPGRRVRTGLSSLIANLPPQRDRLFNLPSPESLIERLVRRPGIKPNANPALAIKNPPGDELAAVANQIDDLAVQIQKVFALWPRWLNSIDGRG